MASSEDCQPLYKTKAVKDIISNLWRISRDFFVYNFFLTFLFFNFLPVIAMAFMISAMDNEDSGIWTTLIFYAFAIVFLLGTVWNVQAEIQEFLSKRTIKYFSDLENWFQLTLNGLNVAVVLYTIVLSD